MNANIEFSGLGLSSALCDGNIKELILDLTCKSAQLVSSCGAIFFGRVIGGSIITPITMILDASCFSDNATKYKINITNDSVLITGRYIVKNNTRNIRR